MYSVIRHNTLNKFIKAWTSKVPVEESAITQLLSSLELPFVQPYVCAMPDIHYGKGSTVGSVIPCLNAIVPAFVGLDVACGMSAFKLGITREDFNGVEEEIRKEFLRVVPTGRTNNGGAGDRGAWHTVPDDITSIWDAHLRDGFDRMESIPGLINAHTNSDNHLGTLGTGNHFLSVSTDESGGIWLVVHSGSRGIGSRIGNFYIEAAQKLCDQFFIKLPCPNMAYLPRGTAEYNGYMAAMSWCNVFATHSRSIMLERARAAIESKISGTVNVLEKINCHHNYVSTLNINGVAHNLVRKGAISAEAGQKVIIPGAMGSRSFIAEGLGNKDSFYTCSHGAGRLMSRTAAANTITLEDHIKTTDGVFCDKDAAILDESPAAYKNIDDVMESQSDLVRVLHTLKEFINIKGKDDKPKRRRK